MMIRIKSGCSAFTVHWLKKSESVRDSLLPNVQIYHDWPKLLEQWKKDADALGKAFAAGDAHVDPKEDLKTCRRCDLQTLCRVYEKFSGLAE